MRNEERIGVLFVCMGNICRSPTAEGVFRHVVTAANADDRLEIDSAGTHAYHVGEPPDRRSQAAAKRRGYSLSALRARRVSSEDFERFDLILGMDRLNVESLKASSDAVHHHKIRLFLDYTDGDEVEVPDPYYGGERGFEYVLDLVEDASRGLLDTLLP